jgi:hypothetical protein
MSMRSLFLLLIIFVTALTVVQAQTISLEPDQLKPVNVKAETVTFKGRQSDPGRSHTSLTSASRHDFGRVFLPQKAQKLKIGSADF